MFGSETKGFANNGSGLLKNHLLEYIDTTLCGLNCGLSLDKKDLVDDISVPSYLYLKHADTNTIFGFSCTANGNGFLLNRYYDFTSGDTKGGGVTSLSINYGFSGSDILNLTFGYNVFDSGNFIMTISNRAGMLPYDYSASLGVLETANDLCLVSTLPTIQYCQNLMSNFTSFTGTLANITPPGGKAITAPAYYPSSSTAITADTIVHCIQARISGITQGGLYKVGGKEYICIHAPSGLLMEVKR